MKKRALSALASMLVLVGCGAGATTVSPVEPGVTQAGGEQDAWTLAVEKLREEEHWSLEMVRVESPGGPEEVSMHADVEGADCTASGWSVPGKTPFTYAGGSSQPPVSHLQTGALLMFHYLAPGQDLCNTLEPLHEVLAPGSLEEIAPNTYRGKWDGERAVASWEAVAMDEEARAARTTHEAGMVSALTLMVDDAGRPVELGTVRGVAGAEESGKFHARWTYAG